MKLKVCKFGGTSVADAAQLRRVKAIVDADPGRRWVVPSAPGKRHRSDHKITDLLYLCHEHARRGVGFDEVFRLISGRYLTIVVGARPRRSTSSRCSPRSARASPPAPTPTTARAAASSSTATSWPRCSACEFVDPAEIVLFDERGAFLSGGDQPQGRGAPRAQHDALRGQRLLRRQARRQHQDLLARRLRHQRRDRRARRRAPTSTRTGPTSPAC